MRANMIREMTLDSRCYVILSVTISLQYFGHNLEADAVSK